jgi:hypothetical protein
MRAMQARGGMNESGRAMRMLKLMRACVWALGLCAAGSAWAAAPADERIRGVLEKTVRPGACAQIRDALQETYYILKNEETEKKIAPYVGRNATVVITGTAETREGDPSQYFALKTVAPAPQNANAKALPEPGK